MDKLSYIDIGILVLLLLLSIKGIWQGIIRGLASFLGILLGIFFASRFYNNVGEWFARSIYDLGSLELNALVGFLILITLIWALCLFIGEIVFRMVKFTPLAVVDSALGLLFGFCKSFLLISIIVFGISQIGWLKNFSQNIEQNSSIFPLMKSLAVRIMNLQQVQEAQENLNTLGTQILNNNELQDGLNNTLGEPTQNLAPDSHTSQSPQ
ncbi:CvpA family protein [Helicobacter jaachi]|uniref:CvpA family protein n=1 Tax=Helicobacter jaachi TaxID=1677920 RepID=A0A4U8TD43_9HELI|nr:CvpA family protein [Helicobacter jaachi]TLD97773.1 CvpA family protein [Helicobacter jaachi]